MQFNTTVTLKEAMSLVTTCGHTNTFIFQSEPGIGKSSMLKALKRDTKMDTRYVDCALLDLGDLQMPKVGDAVDFVPNRLFVGDKPMIIMLDEIGKAMRPVQNALLTLLLEHRIGTTYLPEGSIVFGTTNMASDGVGDMLQAHARNRVSFLTISKPTADEWLAWATANDIDPAVCAWVREYPHCLASYMDGESAKENPYIFNPRKQQDAFVTPRSLEHASHIAKQRDMLNQDTLLAALAGTIGRSAAADMQAFLSVADSLPKWVDIINNPEKAPLPDNAVASVILSIAAAMRVDGTNATAWITYMLRLPKEVQFMFATLARNTPATFVHLTRDKTFRDWAVSNSWAY